MPKIPKIPYKNYLNGSDKRERKKEIDASTWKLPKISP
jgi:hypothetical protein